MYINLKNQMLGELINNNNNCMWSRSNSYVFLYRIWITSQINVASDVTAVKRAQKHRIFHHLKQTEQILKMLDARTRIHDKFLKTFSDRKFYFNTSFRLPVCSLRQVKTADWQSKAGVEINFTIRERFQKLKLNRIRRLERRSFVGRERTSNSV